MFRHKYSHQSQQKNGNIEESSRLVAVFDFYEETSPQDRAVVKKRIQDMVSFKPSTSNYFAFKENITENHATGRLYRTRKGYTHEVKIRRHCNGMGLTVKITSPTKAEAEDLLDMNALNDFVKTGEIKTK